MGNAKIAISLSEVMLRQLDELVSEARYPSRSGAIQEAVRNLLERTSGSRLARECSKLDPEQEIAVAEEGMGYESGSWPEY